MENEEIMIEIVLDYLKQSNKPGWHHNRLFVSKTEMFNIQKVVMEPISQYIVDRFRLLRWLDSVVFLRGDSSDVKRTRIMEVFDLNPQYIDSIHTLLELTQKMIKDGSYNMGEIENSIREVFGEAVP